MIHCFCTLFWKVLMLSLLLLLLPLSSSLLLGFIIGWAWCIFISRHRGPNFWVTPRCRCSNTWLKSFARVLLVLLAPLAYFVFLAVCLHVGVEQLWQDELGAPSDRACRMCTVLTHAPLMAFITITVEKERNKVLESFLNRLFLNTHAPRFWCCGMAACSEVPIPRKWSAAENSGIQRKADGS